MTQPLQHIPIAVAMAALMLAWGFRLPGMIGFSSNIRTSGQCGPDTAGFSRVEPQLRPKRPGKRIPDTTGFSRVVFQLQPGSGEARPRYRRLQPRGVSVTTWQRRGAPQIPPALAAWSFSYNLAAARRGPDTAGFSRAQSPLQPSSGEAPQIPPASAARSFSYNLAAARRAPDTTGFSRVEFQLQPGSGEARPRYRRLQPRGVSVTTWQR